MGSIIIVFLILFLSVGKISSVDVIGTIFDSFGKGKELFSFLVEEYEFWHADEPNYLSGVCACPNIKSSNCRKCLTDADFFKRYWKKLIGQSKLSFANYEYLGCKAKVVLKKVEGKGCWYDTDMKKTISGGIFSRKTIDYGADIMMNLKITQKEDKKYESDKHIWSQGVCQTECGCYISDLYLPGYSWNMDANDCDIGTPMGRDAFSQMAKSWSFEEEKLSDVINKLY